MPFWEITRSDIFRFALPAIALIFDADGRVATSTAATMTFPRDAAFATLSFTLDSDAHASLGAAILRDGAAVGIDLGEDDADARSVLALSPAEPLRTLRAMT